MFTLILFACVAPKVDDSAVDSAAPPPAFTPLTEAAPHTPGTLEMEALGGGGLELPLQVWFPASSVGEEPYRYLGQVASGIADDGVPDCSRPRPVVMFSHGNGAVRFQSWFLTEALAARGFLVAAPDHVGNTAFDFGDVSHDVLITRRPADIVASYDALVAASADPADPLYGCVDEADGYAIVGHSFGGYTTLALAGAVPEVEASAAHCEANGGWLCRNLAAWAEAHPGETGPELSDPRIWAAVAHSPAGYEVLLGGLDDITIPTAVLSGYWDDLTPWEPQVHPLYTELAGSPRALGGILEAGHYGFSNACDMIPTYDDCDAPFLPVEEVHALALGWTYAWLVSALGQSEADGWMLREDARISWEEG